MPFRCINRYACFPSSLHRDFRCRRFAPIPWGADQDARRTVGHACLLHQSTGNDSRFTPSGVRCTDGLEASAGRLSHHPPNGLLLLATRSSAATSPSDARRIRVGHRLHQLRVLCLSRHPRHVRRRRIDSSRALRPRSNYADSHRSLRSGTAHSLPQPGQLRSAFCHRRLYGPWPASSL